MTNLGASLGTALAGSILIAALTSAFLTNIEQSSVIPSRVTSQAQVELASGVPFISDADLEAALNEAHVSSKTIDVALDAYRDARIAGLRSALAILALLAIVALFLAQRIPTRNQGWRRLLRQTSRTKQLTPSRTPSDRKVASALLKASLVERRARRNFGD
jgi:hypothetical protein